jgi:hypothetical protein
MIRTASVLGALALAACSRPNVGTPRYALDIFSEDTVPAHVTVVVSSPAMEVALNGAGFYTVNKVQPVVLTPATLWIRGTGTATISAIDSIQSIAVVPAGTHPDSTESVVTVGRMFRLSRAEGQPTYKLEIARP